MIETRRIISEATCYLTEEGVTNEESKGSNGDGITLLVVKEDSIKEGDMALISSINQCGEWVIDGGFTHHMTGDKNKFLNMEDCNGGIVRFRNDAPCVVKGKGSIALNNKKNCDDVYWVEGLKYSLLSLAQLNKKGYQLEFNEKSGSLIATGKQSRGNLFHLATTIGGCLMYKVEDTWLWHQRLCHFNFDSIEKVSKTKSFRGMPKIVKPEKCYVQRVSTRKVE